MDTNFDNRFYSLSIICGDHYPKAPPTIRFSNRINLPFVDQTNGNINPNNWSYLKSWNEGSSLQGALAQLKQEMKNNKKLQQPPEGEY